jgi:hypothetical protein
VDSTSLLCIATTFRLHAADISPSPGGSHRTYHFPDAFYGQNNKIRETLNNLILKSPQDWQTGVALPFVRINGTTVEWDELRFDVRLLQRVPYEGISRMQTSLRRRHRDRVVRRGIGMTIESECALCLSTHDIVQCAYSTDV